jgi:hypothetical protein
MSTRTRITSVLAVVGLAITPLLHAQETKEKPAADPPPPPFQSELDLHNLAPVDSDELPPLPPLEEPTPAPEPPAASKTIVAPSEMPVVNPPPGKTEQGIAHDPPPAAALSKMPVINVDVPQAKPARPPEAPPENP